LALAAPIGLYDLVNQLLRRIDVFLVGRFLPVGDLGIYAAVHEVASAVKPIRQAFDPILIPVLSGALGRGDRDGMLAQYRTVTRWILILQGAMLAVFLVAGRSVMGIPGPEFTPGAAALGLVGCAMVIHGVLGVSEVFLLVDRPMINLLNSLGALVAQTGLIVLLVPRYGLLGAASATLIGAALMNLARLIEVQALHGLQPFTRYHLRAAAAVAGATGTVLLFRWATAAPAGFLVDGSSAVAVLALYFALLLTLGLGSPERERVQAWLRR
jgi:O-antigen/teichoic acid export membrane protein